MAEDTEALEDLKKRLEVESTRRLTARIDAESRQRQSVPVRFLGQFQQGVKDVMGEQEPIRYGVGESSFGVDPIPVGKPENVIEAAGRTAGRTLPLAPVMGGAASLVGKSTEVGGNLLTRVFRGGRNIVSKTGEKFSTSPGAFTAVETGLGATAGVGGFYAQKAFPDSGAAVFIGEVVGGVAPTLMPINLMRQGAIAARGSITSFRRGMSRAEKRIQRAVPPEARQPAVESIDLPTTIDPKTGRPVLSLAQRTDDKGLLALERDILKSSDELTRAGDEQIARANQVIQEAAQEVGAGDPAQAQNYLKSLVETRLRIAAQKTDERISQLGPKATREQANRIAAEEIDNAVQAAAVQRRALFEAIPEKDLAPTEQGAKAVDALLGRGPSIELPSGETIKTLAKAQFKDIPPEALTFLNSKSKGFLGKETTVGELVGLKNVLAETSRKARAAGDLNQARVADLISEAIEYDIARSSTEASDAIQLALNFSQEFRKKFKQGTVGKLTGMAKEGGRRVPEGLTLEQSIGVSGPSGRQALDDIRKALDGGSPVLTESVSDYLKNRFLKDAVVGGEINLTSARRFLKTNDELLNRLPDLKQEFIQATRSGRMSEALSKVGDPRKSKAALFINKGPDEAFREITKLSPDKAATEVQKLINLAARDQTGEATKGLKSSFIDFMLTRSTQRDANGLKFISGSDVVESMGNPAVRASIRKMFTPEEANRLAIIARDLVRLEKTVTAQASKEGVVGDVPGNVLSTLAGLAGAASGRTTAAKLGLGGTVQIPGIMANRFRQMVASGIKDPAKRVIEDAIQDEKLLKEFLLSGIKDGKLTESAAKRFGLWAASTLAEQAGLSAARSQFDPELEELTSNRQAGVPLVREQEEILRSRGL